MDVSLNPTRYSRTARSEGASSSYDLHRSFDRGLLQRLLVVLALLSSLWHAILKSNDINL